MVNASHVPRSHRATSPFSASISNTGAADERCIGARIAAGDTSVQRQHRCGSAPLQRPTPSAMLHCNGGAPSQHPMITDDVSLQHPTVAGDVSLQRHTGAAVLHRSTPTAAQAKLHCSATTARAVLHRSTGCLPSKTPSQDPMAAGESFTATPPSARWSSIAARRRAMKHVACDEWIASARETPTSTATM